jgi:hypothetical protein
MGDVQIHIGEREPDGRVWVNVEAGAKGADAGHAIALAIAAIRKAIREMVAMQKHEDEEVKP